MLKGLIKREIKCCECGVDLIGYDSSVEPDETGLIRRCKGVCVPFVATILYGKKIMLIADFHTMIH